MPQREFEIAERYLLYTLVALAILSIPLLFTNVGYFRNSVGFQGLLDQPQAFGVAMAVLAAWLASKLALEKPPSAFIGVTLIIVASLLMLSQARTAVLAAIIGILLGVFATMIAGIKPRERSAVVSSIGKILVLSTLSLLIIIAGSLSASDSIIDFVFKRGDGNSIIEAALLSRGRVVELMLANFESNPLLGIGFGIPSEPWLMKLSVDPIFGLPIRVAIEKGVLPLAALEELGLIGVIFVLSWLLVFGKASIRSGFVATSVFATVIVTNFGEATLFSLGGFGLLGGLAITWATSRRPRPKRINSLSRLSDVPR